MRAVAIALLAGLSGACAPKADPAPEWRVPGSAQILEVRAQPDPIAGDVTVVRFVFSANARYKVLELPMRQEVWIDVEGGIPNARTQVGGSVDGISYTTATHSDGRTSMGRVILHLVDPTVGLVSTRGNGAGRIGELRIGPNRHTDENASPQDARRYPRRDRVAPLTTPGEGDSAPCAR